MRPLFGNQWFQLCLVAAVVSGALTLYNQATRQAYTGSSSSNGSGLLTFLPPSSPNSTSASQQGQSSLQGRPLIGAGATPSQNPTVTSPGSLASGSRSSNLSARLVATYHDAVAANVLVFSGDGAFLISGGDR